MVKNNMRGPKVIALFFIVGGLIGEVGGQSLEDECAENFQKLTVCLTYATGKGDTPTGECCAAVSDISGSKPVCLCYIIQQIHDGDNSQLKSLGLQEQRVIQLPSACRLANASISHCPSLLNILPSSPDYAIFTAPPPTTPTSTTVTNPARGSSSPVATERSNGLKNGPQLAGSMAVVIAIIVFTFQLGFVSTFCT